MLHRDVAGRGRPRREYLVKWLGYSELDNTWQPEDHLNNARGAVDRYLHRSGQKVGRRSNAPSKGMKVQG